MAQLGTETGSLVNHLMSRAIVPAEKIEVGMGCTILRWSDRTPATVVEVNTSKSGKTTVIKIQEDKAVRTDNNGMSESQKYEITQDQDGYIWEVRLYSNGWFTRFSDEFGHQKGNAVSFGSRSKYWDPTF